MGAIIPLNIDETATHKRAFSLYSTLDPELSPLERESLVATQLKQDVDDVHSWSSFFNWEQRLSQDAQVLQKGLDARTRKERLREKVDALVNRISDLLSKDETYANIKIDDGKALSQLATALDKLVHTSAVLDGGAVDTFIIKTDKPVSDLTDEELARYVAEGRARASLSSKSDDGPEAA